MDDRIKRISKRLDVTESKAKDIIKKKDKERSSYYNCYTSKKWGDARSYDLCQNPPIPMGGFYPTSGNLLFFLCRRVI